MTQPKVSGLIMTKSMPMSFKKLSIVALLCAPVWAQAPKDSLANLIQQGNRKAALAQIRAGADVNAAQPDGTRPIHWAVYKVDYELLDALIAKKAKVDVANEFGSTPLAEAAKLADARMAKTLLDAGAKPDMPNQDGETALMLAIKTGELPVVQILIKAGANVNARESFHNQTALMWAAAAPKNGGEMVKLLLSKDADVRPRALYSDWESQITSEPRAQYRPVGGLTALLYAARGGCYECVEAMIGSGADVNVPTPEGVTPLMIALDNDHNEVAKLLLDRGANPNLWDWWGRTPLYIAVDRRDSALSPLKTGLLALDAEHRAPLVTHAAGHPPVSSIEIIDTLLRAGVDLNPQLNMHRPSRGGNSGRFVEEFYNTGCTPLLRATLANDVEVVRALLDQGASPNISAMGLTPFLIAAGVGTGGRGTGLASATSTGFPPNMAIMDLLVAHGADVNAQVTGMLTYSLRISRAPSATEGMTALHAASQKGQADVVRYLLAKGANTELLDANGRKPIDLAGVGTGQSAATSSNVAASGGTPATRAGTAEGPRGKDGAGTGVASSPAEIRALLQNAASQR
jgi:ankyrin repeat protein